MSSHPTYAGRLRLQEPEDGCKSGDTTDDGAPALDRSEWVLLGESAAARRLRSQIQRIAPHYRIALIRGESGTGKQAVARAIHARSPAAGKFIVRDARALAEMLERRQPGQLIPDTSLNSLLQAARGGTFHLTRVGELSFSQQEALFRFLRPDERLPEKLAGRKAAVMDISRNVLGREDTTRILAATDDDLRTLAAIGQFRQDLYARLSAVEIFVPPLRDRIDDIGVLSEWLLRRICAATGESHKVLAAETVSQLQDRLWSENLCELERVVARAAALAEGAIIEPRHLLVLVESGLDPGAGAPPPPIERLHDVVRRHTLEVLTRCEGNKLRAAELLGISRSTLYRMLGSRAGRGKDLLE